MTFSFRRVVTGHDDAGRAVVKSDSTVSADPRLPGYHAKVFWATSRFPPSNDEATFDDGIPGPHGTRVLFRIGEFLPGESAVPNMHRTETQDVAVIMSGELDLVLDSGEVVRRLGVGDVVVQRGTMHSWVARGADPVRVLFVLMDAPPARVGDLTLAEDLTIFGGLVSPMPRT